MHKPLDSNYNASKKSQIDKLRNNLIGTEIDIVLETSECLFIGEAKDYSGFGDDSSYVLVHQLIRQYVMATLLVEKLMKEGLDRPMNVVPFVEGRDVQKLKNHGQIDFMIQQGKIREGWLREENVLSWEDIKKLSNDV